MPSWISFYTFLTVVALFLLTWSTSGPKRRPVLALAALLAIGYSLFARFAATPGLVAAVAGVITDLGLAAVVSAFYLRRRRAHPKAMLSLGILLLVAAALLQMTVQLIDTVRTDPASVLPAHVADQFLLELGPDDQIEELADLLDQADATYERAFPNVSLVEDENLAQYYIVYAEPDRIPGLMDALRADRENVDTVEWNLEISLDPLVEASEEQATASVTLADDPMIASQWWFTQIGIDDVHRMLENRRPLRKARVAILDTGVDARHEDLNEAYGGASPATDENGHGTHCAGIAGAVANNGRGIASLNWEGRFIDLHSYQVLNRSGFGTSEGIAQGIVDAARDGADVISLSLGSWAPAAPKVQRDAVAYAIRRNAVVVAAAGNNNGDARQHAPSNIKDVISVAAIDSKGSKAKFSNRNTGMQRPISAPGVDILSSKPGSTYARHNGTSMATPMVSGLAGLLRALDPTLTPEQVYNLIVESAETLSDARSVGKTIHAARAVEQVLARDPVVAEN